MGGSSNVRTIGTAGHVDHGKSTLVHALTGMNPDRLQEELDRQMTIDLGFAWLTLDDGQEVGIVDVPGHRDFIDNMLAGVGSIDAVMFVIAADEGIMPQTREHLAILDLLQISRGIIALTKKDLVEDEWLDLVTEEARELFSTTILKNSPIIPVSAKNHSGIDKIKQALSKLLIDAPVRVDKGRPRISIDRVFSLTGFGTVVTGTLVGGSLSEGQEVEILPKGLKARIRNLQSHKSQRKQVQPGGRVALNLSGVDKAALARGDTVVLPEQWNTSSLVDAWLHTLPDLDASLKHNQEVKIYHGASQRMARIRLIGQSEISPGDDGWVQFLLSEEMVVDRGDHFIVRRPSPGATLGGGQIVDPHPARKYRQKDKSPHERLEKLLVGDPMDIVLDFVRTNGPIAVKDVNPNVEVDNIQEIINSLIVDERLIKLGNAKINLNSFLVTRIEWEKFKDKSSSILNAYHEKYPLRPGMPIQEYRTRMQLDPKWAPSYIESANEQLWFQNKRNLLSLPSHIPALNAQEQGVVDKLLKLFESQPFNTPSRREILLEIDEEILQYLIWSEQLVSLSDDVLFTGVSYSQALQMIREVFKKQDTLTVAEVRDLFNTSRKYALALMEYLDACGITRRDGDVRRLTG
jgi:selenocysteine-specific elongation factor